MKTIIVTGATKGLGLAITAKLLDANYKVVGISRSESNDFLDLKNKNANLFFYSYDFTNSKGISSLVKDIINEHGRPYGLINNAAIGLDGILATMHESDIEKLLSINVLSPIILTKYISRSMLLSKEGRIINIGSIIGSTGFSGLSVYAATKASLEGFSKSLARELGKQQITVNTLAPGYMNTEMTSGLVGDKLEKIIRRSPLGRLADTSDVAAGVVFLLSEEAASVTGITLTIDAGSVA